MMMWFDSEKPRKFLEENEFVATFRTYDYKRKDSLQLARTHDTSVAFGIRIIGKVVICNLKDVYSSEDLEPFSEFSGFENVDEWRDEIFKLDGVRVPYRGGFKKLGNLCFVVKL